MYRYYLTQREPGPGTQPKGATVACAYGSRQPVPEIGGRSAWGYVEYREPLTPQEIEAYELVGACREEGAT